MVLLARLAGEVKLWLSDDYALRPVRFGGEGCAWPRGLVRPGAVYARHAVKKHLGGDAPWYGGVSSQDTGANLRSRAINPPTHLR